MSDQSSSASVLCVGHAVQDFVFQVPALPTLGEKYRATSFAAVGGGPAATAAVAIARLGGTAKLAARVGDDSLATLIIDELIGHGVDCSWMRRCQGAASSVSAVMVDAAGERQIINHLDPRLPTTPDWLPDPVAAGARAVLVDTRWPEGAARALTAARAAGLPAVLDADRPVPRSPALVELATHAAFSAEGLADYTGNGDPVAALASIANTIPGWCCVTVGAGGVYFTNAVAGPGARSIEHEPAFQVPVVDTLGAGDVWHGAFALALAEGRSPRDAIRFAQAAAALKVQRFGGRAGAPRRAEVDAFLSGASRTPQAGHA